MAALVLPDAVGPTMARTAGWARRDTGAHDTVRGRSRTPSPCRDPTSPPLLPSLPRSRTWGSSCAARSCGSEIQWIELAFIDEDKQAGEPGATLRLRVV
jgi:hypothetical protein